MCVPREDKVSFLVPTWYVSSSSRDTVICNRGGSLSLLLDEMRSSLSGFIVHVGTFLGFASPVGIASGLCGETLFDPPIRKIDAASLESSFAMDDTSDKGRIGDVGGIFTGDAPL